MTEYYFEHEVWEAARKNYILYKNGWHDLEYLHRFLFELCGCDIKKAYYLLLQLEGREVNK